MTLFVFATSRTWAAKLIQGMSIFASERCPKGSTTFPRLSLFPSHVHPISVSIVIQAWSLLATQRGPYHLTNHLPGGSTIFQGKCCFCLPVGPIREFRVAPWKKRFSIDYYLFTWQTCPIWGWQQLTLTLTQTHRWPLIGAPIAHNLGRP